MWNRRHPLLHTGVQKDLWGDAKRIQGVYAEAETESD